MCRTARRTLVASSALGRNTHSLARNPLYGFLAPFLCRVRRILGRAERRGLAIRLVVALRVRLPRVAGRQLGLELAERVVPDGGVAHRVDGVVVGARGRQVVYALGGRVEVVVVAGGRLVISPGVNSKGGRSGATEARAGLPQAAQACFLWVRRVPRAARR
eukprot:scaffold23379_cov71-Phaeocystis_antarctica.AAC.4